MNLHERIMNLPAKAPKHWGEKALVDAHAVGHAQGRHAAAELANEHATMADELRKEVERCFDIAQALDAMNPTLLGAFTGTPSERIQRQMDAMAETL